MRVLHRTRATTETAKQARRAALLDAAAGLFRSREFDEVSVEDIARKARLAKGTVYLYFGTKESLFLELVWEELARWLHESADAVRAARGDPAQAAEAVASTLSCRPALIRLLALLHAVLERNSETAALLRFKQRLLETTREAAALFEETLGLPPGQGVRLTLWMHALIVGLAQMTTCSPLLPEVVAEDPSLAAFQLDFRTELAPALAALFSGARHS